MKRASPAVALTILTLLLLAGAALAACWGESGFINPFDGGEADRAMIFWELRLPRVVLAVLVGGCLAVSGAIMQALFQNSMADPFILGVSPGAGLGAVLAITLGVPLAGWGLGGVALAAFAGGLAAMVVVYFLAARGGALPVGMLLLTGLAVGGVATALMTFMLLRLNVFTMRSALTWLLGSLAYRGWMHVLVLVPVTILGVAGAQYFHRTVNLLAFGDAAAHHLGVRVERAKLRLLALASIMAAATVAVAGTIGFIGLMAPHIMRLIVGPNHRVLLPACVLGGGLLLLAADVLARSLLPGQEIPIGIVTSILGGLFFLSLLRRARSF